MGILANENAISSGGYQISNSLRFQRASSQYLTRTPSVAGNQKTWTWSAWVKRGNLTYSTAQLFNGYDTGNNRHIIYFESTDQLYFQELIGGATQFNLYTSAVFRDPSSWYHIVVAWDTTQATASNRVKIWVNNVQQTLNGSYPSLNFDGYINGTQGHTIGKLVSEYFDGYMTEINFVNAQALTPSSFGSTDPISGQWVAAKYTGTYGTNGFYLPFSNGTSTTTLGADSSGNGNNWTLTNFTRSAGVSDCWMYDVPSGNGGVAGTQPNSNYAVINPLRYTNSVFTTAKANLSISSTSGGQNQSALNTIGVSSGKWYAEFIPTVQPITNGSNIGVTEDTTSLSYIGAISNAVGYEPNGQKLTGSSFTSYGATYAVNDVIGVALDMDAGSVTFYKNNVSQGVAKTGLTGTQYMGVADHGGTSAFTWECNFGQRSFAYTPPSGYKALCTANLPVATIKQGNKYMDATLYTGNGGSQTVTNAAGFKPDLVWLKNRSSAYNHALNDSVRGAGQTLESNTTNSEFAYSAYFTAINSNGFSLAGGIGQFNLNTNNYVGWQWQAGQGTTSSNTNGSITSTVSVSPTAGFSIVTYTGNATTGATVGHGLGVKPAMVILKTRTGGIETWPVWQKSLASESYFLRLNETSAVYTNAGRWTAFSSTTITLGNNSETNGSGYTYVAYCFAEIAGFSKFGSYTGNGSTDGPFVYCGFRPKFVMVKIYSGTTGDWAIFDTSRSTYNEEKLVLWPNLSIAESTGSDGIDGLANGFKIRSASNYINGSSSYSYIYMAFAENPFAQANAR